MNDNLSVEEKIDAILNWFRTARPGDGFTPHSTVELETRQENAAYAALIPKFPHIKRMVDLGWIVMDGRYAILTAAGKAEMERRGMTVTGMDESLETKLRKQPSVRSKAWKEGFDAAYKKLPPHPPYPLDSKEAADWGDGYVAGQD